MSGRVSGGDRRPAECRQVEFVEPIVGHDRAIVSDIAGTTRDTISEEAQIRGIPVVFVDTAGLQETEDVVEQEECAAVAPRLEADLVLHVLDASEPPDPDAEARRPIG